MSLKINPVYILIVFLIISMACDKNDPVAPQNSPPVLINFAVPDTIFIGINENNIISVECQDNEGLDDIDSVYFKIFNQNDAVVSTGLLYDDGNYASHGDITPKNGRYSARIAEILVPGDYRVRVAAVDQSGERSDELEKSFYAKQAIVNNAPVVTEVFISDTAFVDEPAPFFIQVKATDPDTNDFVARVSFQILDPGFTEILASGDLYDDGTHGDVTPGDSVFSIEITSAFASWKFGIFNLYVQAIDGNGKSSLSLYKTIPWGKINIGEAPIVSDLVCPDTLQLPADSSYAIAFVISIKADDPDHSNDVKEVFFNVYKPDGNISDSSPLQMYDNGASGDEVADDNIYSLRVFLVYSNDVGDYRFEFQARDYSDLLSNKITHIITVIR